MKCKLDLGKHFYTALPSNPIPASDSYSGFCAQFYYMLPLKGIWCFLSLEIHLHLNDLK